MAREVRYALVMVLGGVAVVLVLELTLWGIINAQIDCNEVNKSYAQAVPSKCQ